MIISGQFPVDLAIDLTDLAFKTWIEEVKRGASISTKRVTKYFVKKTKNILDEKFTINNGSETIDK